LIFGAPLNWIWILQGEALMLTTLR
jgi:hypothetical protein